MFDEFGEGDPASGVHVEVVLVLDEFLVHPIREYAFRSEPDHDAISDPLRRIMHRNGDAPPREELDKVVLELAREVGNVSACVFADDEHLAKVGLGLGVAFEAVLVSALFLADLTVPSKAL